MNPEEKNEVNFRMITPEGKEFPVNSSPIENWDNDIWKAFDDQKQVFDAEIKKAFEYCNVPLKAIGRAELAIDKDDNSVLTIDKRPVLISYKPEFLYSQGKAVQRFKRLYGEGAE